MWEIYQILLVLTCAGHVMGYGTGPPSERCDNMYPGHDTQTQTGDAPFRVTFLGGKTTYSENEQIQVRLEKTGSDVFAGFFIQPRLNAETYQTFGRISNGPSGTINPCGNKGEGRDVSLSHSNDQPKSSVTFTWTAPPENVGDIVFVYTVVQEFSTFWVKLTSSPLRYRSAEATRSPTGAQTEASTNLPTNPPTNQPTYPPTDPPTNPPSETSKIDRDPACGVTKGCFPPDCKTNCDYLVSWRVSGTEDVEFTLQKKTPDNNHYIAIGLSDDPKMGNDSVAQCVALDGVVDVGSSFNVPSPSKSNELLDNPVFGVKLLSGSFADGILKCTFLRKKNAALASVGPGRRRQAAANEMTFFDLSQHWYLFVAHGYAYGGDISPHTDDPFISMEKIDFLTVKTDTVIPATGKVGIIKKDSTCGESKGCFHNCDESGTCGFLLTWKDNGDDVDMTLTCNRGKNNVYCAIGLSSDDKMGDDSVIECVSSNNQTSAYVSYNEGRDNYRLKEAQFGLSKMSATFVDGILKCTFSRKKTAALASAGRRKRAVDASASNYFDMNKDWNLFYAYGTSVGGDINKHDVLPTVSTQKADFQSFMDIGASTVEKPLIKVHGILMTLAWLFFATLGIFSARFYKTVWPDGMEWCSQKRWFVIHRFCMVTAFLLTAVAFIVIFVHVGGYADIEGSNYQKSHPIIGIIVMCLALINPIMALCRPHPGTPRRPVFNVAHKLVGVSAQVCSIVNIFSGTALTAAAVPSSNRIVLWIFVGWIILLDIILYIYDAITSKDFSQSYDLETAGKRAKRDEAYELKQTAGDADGKAHLVSQFKVAVLVLYVLVLLGLSVAVCIIIGMAEEGEHHHHEM